jgi:hypothetical protein
MESRRLYREQVMQVVLEEQVAYLEKLVARGDATSWVLQTMEDDKALLRELTGREQIEKPSEEGSNNSHKHQTA